MAQSTEQTLSGGGVGTIADESQRRHSILDQRASRSPEGYWRRAARRFLRDKLATVALISALIIIVLAIAAPLISQYVTGVSPYANNLPQRMAAPGTEATFTSRGETTDVTYYLGADANGRDVLTRLIYGARTSLLFAGLATLSTLILGGVIGSAAGFFGGVVDAVAMRIVDVLLSIPTLVLLILIYAAWQPGYIILALSVAAVSWSGVSRLVRGEVLSFRHRDFVDAARVIGASNGRILFRHIIPNVVPTVVVWLSLALPGYILLEASLSYLGLGVQVPTPSWGNMLQDAKTALRSAGFLIIIPGVAIFFTALCLNLVGNGLRDALDPRLND